MRRLNGGSQTYCLTNIDELGLCLDAVRGLPPVVEIALRDGVELCVLKPGGPVAVVRRPAPEGRDAPLLIHLVEDVSGDNLLARGLVMTDRRDGDEGYPVGRFNRVARGHNRVRYHRETEGLGRAFGEAPPAAKADEWDDGELAHRVREAETDWCGRTDRADGEAIRSRLSESKIVEEMLAPIYTRFRQHIERDRRRAQGA